MTPTTDTPESRLKLFLPLSDEKRLEAFNEASATLKRNDALGAWAAMAAVAFGAVLLGAAFVLFDGEVDKAYESIVGIVGIIAAVLTLGMAYFAMVRAGYSVVLESLKASYTPITTNELVYLKQLGGEMPFLKNTLSGWLKDRKEIAHQDYQALVRYHRDRTAEDARIRANVLYTATLEDLRRDG